MIAAFFFFCLLTFDVIFRGIINVNDFHFVSFAYLYAFVSLLCTFIPFRHKRIVRNTSFFFFGKFMFYKIYGANDKFSSSSRSLRFTFFRTLLKTIMSVWSSFWAVLKTVPRCCIQTTLLNFTANSFSEVSSCFFNNNIITSYTGRSLEFPALQFTEKINNSITFDVRIVFENTARICVAGNHRVGEEIDIIFNWKIVSIRFTYTAATTFRNIIKIVLHVLNAECYFPLRFSST